MPALTEIAKAKVNLTLRIFGRRRDGFHELESLVAFADFGDLLELEPGEGLEVECFGPFAGALGDHNLVAAAAEKVMSICPECRAGRFRLEKKLPAAAGIGGGSADAAAALRLLFQINREHLNRQDLAAIATQLGADVTVCLEQRFAAMWGLGERVAALGALPEMPVVLVNPGVALGTADVFRALGAGRYQGPERVDHDQSPPAFESVEAAADYLRRTGNDLEPAAIELVPAISDALASLSSQTDCLIARMSGSGATCFGLFRDHAGARRAADRIGAAHSDWWVVASNLS